MTDSSLSILTIIMHGEIKVNLKRGHQLAQIQGFHCSFLQAPKAVWMQIKEPLNKGRTGGQPFLYL